MVVAVLAVFLMGVTTGVAVETNNPKVSDFGDKYLSASSNPEAQDNPSPKKR
jgi:hypothetical protein